MVDIMDMVIPRRTRRARSKALKELAHVGGKTIKICQKQMELADSI